MHTSRKLKDIDALSTVTDLISPGRSHQASENKRSHLQKREKSFSTRLEKYIKNYERSQTRDLAEVLTRHVPGLAPRHEENKENELQKEINIARSLLGIAEGPGNARSPRTMAEDLQTLSTDDLLTMDLQSISGFHKNRKSTFLNRDVLSIRQPVLYSTPNKSNANTNVSKPSPMRFSEIATTLRSEFDDVFGVDSSTDLSESESNLFTLNGSVYTPHKEKYKSMWTELDEARRSTKTPETNESDVYELTNSTPSKTLTTDAGRTPYRSHCHSRLHDLDISDTHPQSSISCSHYSVPFEFKGRDEIVDFMKDCLGSDSDAATSVDKKSGSVETLKNMLFTLQSVSLKEEDEGGTSQEVPENSVKDGPSSLKLAISHLSNLQHLLT